MFTVDVATIELNKEKNVGWGWVEWYVAQVKMPVIGETRGAEPLWCGK
jgi:hypothetical protein